jgi:hypothetical protein
MARKPHRFRALLLLGLVFLASCGEGSPSAEIVDSGIYNAVVITSGNWELKLPVTIASVHKLEHREETNSIPAEDGRYWGLRVMVNNPTSQPVHFRSVIKHPLFTSPLGTKSTEEVGEGNVPPGKSAVYPSLWYFIDSCEFEFVPGKWTHQIFLDGEEVIHKEFDIYKTE